MVISRLRGCALQWWENYKIKRRKKGNTRLREEIKEKRRLELGRT